MATTYLLQSNMDQPRKVAKPARGQLYPWQVHIYVLVQYCCFYWFVYQVPVYFIWGHVPSLLYMHMYMCNYSGMYVELVYMYDYHNWARLPNLLAVS